MTLDDIQQAIAKLTPADRAKLRAWLAEFEPGQAEHREPEDAIFSPKFVPGFARDHFSPRRR